MNEDRFCEKVWELCSQIPYGRVSTYKIIAERLGCKAYRAVGMALNKNKNWPKVPCHRVVGSDGKLVGFARGLDEKKRLLVKEGVGVRNNRVIELSRVLYNFK